MMWAGFRPVPSGRPLTRLETSHWDVSRAPLRLSLPETTGLAPARASGEAWDD